MRAVPRGPRMAAVALGLAIAAAAGFAQDREEIRRIIGSGAYEKAVSLALQALEGDPADAEVRFLLARAYSYSGRWDDAEAVLGEILAGRPADTEALLLKARILSWRNDFDAAELLFRRVLALEPGSADARAGLADLASWRGRYDEALTLARQALDLDPLHAGALFRTGSILLWQGDYGRARGYLARAVELEPRNRDFARALAGAAPPLAPRTEIWIAGRRESWSDDRDDYADLGLSALFGVFDDRARILVKVNRAWRAGGRDDQIGLEAYPRLWKGAYGYLDLSLAPEAEFVPASSLHFEIYQSLFTRFEVSLGARRMNFPANGVSLVAASAAAYWGRFYPNVRLFWADSDAGTEMTWMAGLRGYFSGESYAWAAFGRGTRSFETGSVEEILAGPAWFAEAGFDVYVSRTIKVRAYLSRRREAGGPSSVAFALVTGYRF